MPNKTTNGKSGGGKSVQWDPSRYTLPQPSSGSTPPASGGSVQWNPSPGHMNTPGPTWTFSKGHWAPAPTGSISTFGGMQTVSAQPAASGQLPAMGKPTNPVMEPQPMPQPQQPAQQQPQMASPEMRQRFEGLNPFVQWLFAQNASRRGMGPAMLYQNFYNRRHGL